MRSVRRVPSSDRARNQRNVRVLWAGLQASAGRMRCRYMEVVRRGWPIEGEVFDFKAHQLIDVTLNHNSRTMNTL